MNLATLTRLAGMGALDELGARRARRRSKASSALKRALSTPAPGVQRGGARQDTLGLTPVTFVNGGATLLAMNATVQKVFKGERLVLVRTNVGAASPGLTVTIQSFFIGQTNQFASADPVAVELYGATAVGVAMALDTVTPAIIFRLNIQISAAPAAAETVTISGGCIGLTLAGAL